MTPLESLHQQMEQSINLRRSGIWPTHKGNRFLCIEDLVLQHGTAYQRSAEKPPIHPIPKACFAQAYRLATTKNSKWVYCEGYAVGKVGLAMQHAWVIRTDDPREAHELAWDEDTVDASAYIGIPFQAEFVKKMHLASKRTHYSVLDAWWINYPLISGEIRIQDVIWKGQQ